MQHSLASSASSQHYLEDPEWGRTFYSSEINSAKYAVPTCGMDLPGPKWSTRKFNSGIRASAWNERFLAMRQAEEDLRPFAGAPFDPTNTFVTTGPWRQGTAPSLAVPTTREPSLLPGASPPPAHMGTTYPVLTSLVEPTPNPPLAHLTWAQLKASR